MKNGFLSISLILMLFFSSLSLTSIGEEDKSDTWYVDDDGGADFTCVQDAVDAASPGDTIFVYSGLYVENIVVNKTLKLIGEDKNTTVLDGNYTEDTLFITDNADYVEITDFTFQHAGERSWFTDRLIDPRGDHCHIYHNIFNDTKYSAITIEESNYHTIEYNQFSNLANPNYDAINVYDSKETMIANNTFSKVNVACLCMSYADYCTIQDNNMNNVDCGVLLNGGMGCQVRKNLIVDSNTGIVLQEFSEMNAVYENTIKDCDWGITSSIDGPPGSELPAWSFAFHNNLMDIDYDTVNRGGTYMYAPYPAGGNYFNDYNGTDEYSGPDQDIPGSDGIIDEPWEDNDPYAFVEQDGWKYTDIEPTLIVLGGFDWRVLAPYWMEPGESRSYQFYILNGGNSAPVRWRIEEIPEYGSWEFEEISGSVEPSDGMVRIPFLWSLLQM